MLIGNPADAMTLGSQLASHGDRWDHRALQFESSGFAFALAEESWRGIVFLAPSEPDSAVDEPFAEQTHPCKALLALLQEAAGQLASRPSRIYVVSGGVNAVLPEDVPDVRSAPLFGLARSAASELPRFQVTTIDVLSDEDSYASVAMELLADSTELEVAYRGGQRYVPRISRLPLEPLGRRRTRVRLDPASDRSYRVVSPKPGSLDQVTLETTRRRAPHAGEVEIRVAAAGLNFLDVLRSLNMGPAQSAGAAYFGMELAGEVARVGGTESNLRIGDAVVALAPTEEMCFQAWVTVPAHWVWRVPAGFTMEQAASCLVAYQTAWYALVELGRLRAGERVLIHAAAGGVGLAAVFVAQHLGAEVFATAGSPEKREYLQSLGVTHLMDSRTLAFADEVLTETQGRGVDLVLNSISGEAIPKSIATLAPGGRFLEIGKRDIYANSSLELFPFRKNLSYYAVDMLGLMGDREEAVLRVTHDVWELLSSGALPPLPLTAFPASTAADAFRFMAQSRQIGKVVVTFREEDVKAEIPADQLIRSDGTYLITGGLSGIGFECARWLARSGARHLVLAGRRQPNADEAGRVDELRQSGAHVVTPILDVSRRADVQRVIADIDAGMPPLAGVIHSAGVIRDAILERMQWEQFEEVFAPKIHGSWNLHTELADRELDFFVLFSSVASWMGSAGQSNYAAANAFLDSLGEYRSSRGLAALTVNWGPWSGLGMLERHHLKPSPMFGEQGISAEQGMASLAALLSRNVSHATVMTVDWNMWGDAAPALASRPLMAEFWGEMSSETSKAERSTQGIAGEIAGRSRTAAVQLIRERLTAEVINVLRIAQDRFDTDTGLHRLGLDSLMAVELSHRIHVAVGVEVSVMRLLKGPTVEELAASIYAQIEPSLPEASSRTTRPETPPDAKPTALVRPEAPRLRVRPGSWIIKEGDQRQALFCLGGVAPWPAVAQQLVGGNPVIGVVPLNVESGALPRIEDYAAATVKVIREQQPSGPYHLAGWSVWGLVALEVAQQLMSASQEVRSLTIVDSFVPPASQHLTTAGQLAAWGRMERRRMLYHLRKLREQRAREMPDYIRERLESFVRFRLRPLLRATFVRQTTPLAGIQRSKYFGDTLLTAITTYRAKPYSGRTLLCMADDCHDGSVQEHVRLWQTILRGQLDVLVLEGDHASLFNPENAGPLLERLRLLLSEDSNSLKREALAVT